MRAGQRDLLEITRPTFRTYLAELAERGIVRASVARKVSTIHTFYRYLVTAGVLARDPLNGVSPPTMRKRLGHEHLQTTLRYAEQSDGTADAEVRACRRQHPSSW